MSVSLDKSMHTHAVIPFGDLIFRGKIVKRRGQSIMIKPDSCTGRLTGAQLPIMVGSLLWFVITPECDLYR